jgi:hypothetical protein
VAWSGELGFGVREPERGQQAHLALEAGPAVEDDAEGAQFERKSAGQS